MSGTTIGISSDVKKLLKDFKGFMEINLKDKITDDRFVKFLIETNPRYLIYVNEKRLRKLKEEWLKENTEEIKEPFEEFKKRKLKESVENE